MTATNEFRVRPVTRFNLTHFQADGAGSGVRSLGEFDSVEQAEEIGILLSSIVPNAFFRPMDGRAPSVYPMVEMVNKIREGAPAASQYVIVAVHTFKVDTKAYFADNLVDAEARKTEAELTHGTEFRIFSR